MLSSAFVVLGLCASAPAYAQFGLPSLGGSSSSAASADPDAFVKTAKEAEALMKAAVDGLSNAVLSKEKVEEIEAQRKAAAQITDTKERDAKLAEVQKSQLAAINEAAGDSNFKANIEKMDAKKKENLMAAAFNFLLALLKDKDLIDQGKSVISSISSNPMNLGKLGAVKDVLESIVNQASAGSKIFGKVSEIMTVVGVKAPTSKDDKPKKQTEKGD